MHDEVTVRPGAWNTGWHDGSAFTQWIGSPAQQQALTRLDEISQAIYAARRNAVGIGVRDPEVYRLLEEAHWRVLQPARRRYDSGVSQITPSGGTVITAEAGWPCQGSGMASMAPRLPLPLPPYTVASVFRISSQRPARGRPIR